MADHRLGGAGLDHLAEVKYRHFAGQLRDCAHIVRDEQISQTTLALKLVKQRQDLVANRDIECGNRFVENHDPWFGGQRACNGNALTLSTG